MAITEAAKEAIWLRQLLQDFGIPTSSPMVIREDNQGCIALTKNSVFHARTKHIDIKLHFIREKVKEGDIIVEYCSTKEMIADILTKGVPKTQFEYLRFKMGLE